MTPYEFAGPTIGGRWQSTSWARATDSQWSHSIPTNRAWLQRRWTAKLFASGELDAEALRVAPPIPQPTPFEQYVRVLEASGKSLSGSELESLRKSFAMMAATRPGPSPNDLPVQTSSGGEFGVFLCHNSADKPSVRQIAQQLKGRGLRVWLDEWELRPGLDWQTTLEQVIENIKAAAVLVGNSGVGPWQNRELKAFINEFVRRGCPVIPVILPDCQDVPRLPLFLISMTWVDSRKKEPNPLEALVWGITGKKPEERCANPKAGQHRCHGRMSQLGRRRAW